MEKIHTKVEALRPYLPERIYNRISREQDYKVKSSEHLAGSIMFIDLSRFTNLTSLLAQSGPRGAETLQEILTGYYSEIITIIRSFGGTVYQFAGDSVLCAFEEIISENSQPTFSAPHYLRATICALKIKAAIDNFRKIIVGNKSFTMAAKISVDSGDYYQLVLGQSSHFFSALITGDAVASAVAMEKFASPGDILIGANAWKFLPNEKAGEPFKDFYKLHQLNVSFGIPAQNVVDNIKYADEEKIFSRCSRFMQRGLVEKNITGAEGFLGEFREVTSLFIRFDGIDLLPSLGSAILKLNQFFCFIQETCDLYGGSLVQADFSDKGNVLLVLFGAPIALEKKETMAARFALKTLATKDIMDFINTIKIGISTGPAYCGDVGAKFRKGYSSLGETLNLASRSMMEVPGSGIYIDQSTLSKLPSDFEATKIEVGPLKGIEKEVHLFKLLKMKSSYSTESKSRNSEFIGRKKEVTELASWLTQAKQKSMISAIVGDIGIGKSRLTEELLEISRQTGFRAIVSPCYSYEKYTPYFPWKEIFLKLFDCRVDESSDKVIWKIEEALSNLEDVNSAWGRVIANIMGHDIHEQPLTLNLDPKQKNERIFEITFQMIQAAAKKQPLLIVIEDFHWIDEISIKLVQYLMEIIGKESLLIILISRPEEISHDFIALNEIKVIYLTELGEEDSRQFICKQMHLAAADENLENLIYDRTHGNPFFIESIIQTLKEQEYLTMKYDGTFELKKDINTLVLPNSLNDIILARIDRLGENEQVILKTASVVGRVFPYDTMSALTPDSIKNNIDRYLDILAKKDFTNVESTEPLAYIFKHVLIRDVAYGSLLSATRQKIHDKIGFHLESRGEKVINEYLDMLAFHFTASGNREKAIQYGIRAARKAAENYANSDAIHHYTTVIDFLKDKSQDQKLLYEIKGELGHVYRQAGNYAEAIDIFQEPLAMEKNREKLAALYTGLGRVYQEMGYTDKALTKFETALNLLGKKVPSSRLAIMLEIIIQVIIRVFKTFLPFLFRTAGLEKAKILQKRFDVADSLGKIYFFVNAEKLAWSIFVEANIADRLKSNRNKSLGYSALGLIYLGLSPGRRSEKAFAKSKKYADISGDPTARAVLWQRSGTIGMYQNDPVLWADYSMKASRIYKQVGEIWERMLSLSSEAIAYMYSGEYEKCIIRYTEVGKMAIADNGNLFLGWAQASIACAEFFLGEKNGVQTLATLTTAEKTSTLTKDLANLCYIQVVRCYIALQEKDSEFALETAEETYKRINNYQNIIPHSHIGYAALSECILLAAQNGQNLPGRFKRMLKTSVLRSLKLGDKFPFIKGAALRTKALYLYHLGREQQAHEAMLEAVEFLEKSPNNREKARVYYDAALYIENRRDEFIEKGLANAEHYHYKTEIERLKLLRETIKV